MNLKGRAVGACRLLASALLLAALALAALTLAAACAGDDADGGGELPHRHEAPVVARRLRLVQRLQVVLDGGGREHLVPG
jgi:hypothetical protein